MDKAFLGPRIAFLPALTGDTMLQGSRVKDKPRTFVTDVFSTIQFTELAS